MNPEITITISFRPDGIAVNGASGGAAGEAFTVPPVPVVFDDPLGADAGAAIAVPPLPAEALEPVGDEVEIPELPAA